MLSKLLLATSVVALAACVSPAPLPAPQVAPAPVVEATAPSGLDLAGFDRSVRPQDDLYRFGGGAWLKATPIPADKSNYGTFTRLADDAEATIRDLIEALAQRPDLPMGSTDQKIGNFYSAYMDVEQIESVGLQPLVAPVSRIAVMQTTRDVVRYMGAAQRLGVAHPIAFQRTPGAREPWR